MVCRWAPQAKLCHSWLSLSCEECVELPWLAQLGWSTHVNSRVLVQLMGASVFIPLSLAISARHQRFQQYSVPHLLTQKDAYTSLCLECCSLSSHLPGLSLLSGSRLTFSKTFLSLEKATVLWLTPVPGSCLGNFRCSKLPEQMPHGACSLLFCKLSLTLCGGENMQFEFFILLKHSLIFVCVWCCSSEGKAKENRC